MSNIKSFKIFRVQILMKIEIEQVQCYYKVCSSSNKVFIVRHEH